MSFFKAYDMRGRYGADFDLNTVYRIGRNLPAVIRRVNAAAERAGTVPARGPRTGSVPLRALVGHDARMSSPAVASALGAGLAAAGVAVTDLGPATTPMVYFFTAEEGFDFSVMVTASHNPPQDNGLKVSAFGAVPVGYEAGLAEVERAVRADASRYAGGASAPPAVDAARLAAYVAWLRAHGNFDADASALRIAVDCSDGMAGLFAHRLFGRTAHYLNDRPDGAFPHHAPNPLLAEAREQIAAIVRAEGLDAGLVFDGDADRCVFVDENGAFIQPDFLIPILAETFPGDDPVIHDVRTSRAAIERIRSAGRTPCMGRVGHAYAKMLLRETGAVCGGELAGHYYFRDFHCCDSGALAALRLLGAFDGARRRGLSVSEFLRPVTHKYFNSGEMNFLVRDKAAALRGLLQTASRFGRETGRCEKDGVRLEFANGWISIRASNTEPYLRLIVECAAAADLTAWTARFKAELAHFA